MILVDTSAWVEFLRGTESAVCHRVEELIGQDLATTDPVRMEVLAGARDNQHLDQLRRLLARCVSLHITTADFDDAAALYRRCRANGETVRRMNDCLIAAVAIRAQVPILHQDADFVVISRHTPLQTA